jgi:MYXO-CTERM domain-containing protein
MNRRALGLVGGLVTILGALPAQAETLVFSEDWEGPTNTWATSKRCNALQGANAADIGASIAPIPDAEACSGKMLRDTNLFSGGYMYLRKKATPAAPIPVAAAETYCLSTWIRSPVNTIATGGGYVSIQYTNSPEGDIINNQLPGEHFIIGGESDGDIAAGRYGATPATLRDAKWHRYQKGWTVTAADMAVSGTVSNKMIVKTVNFVGGAGAGCIVPPTQGAAIDFDDIRIYKLAAGETLANFCPEGVDGNVHTNPLLATRPDETQHATCAGATPTCNKAANGVYSCGKCAGTFGSGVAGACPTAAAPVCTMAGDCKACAEDNGVAGAVAACGAALPYCKTDGSCAKCGTDADCKETTKNHGPGANKCDVAKGSCANGCTVATEGSDCTNPNRPWCDVMPGSTVGVCQEKLANGGALPNRDGDQDPDKGKCNDANGIRFCAVGFCDKADNKCGFANGSTCIPSTDDAKCRADVCGADKKCGTPVDGACTKESDCREGSCSAGKCVLPITGTDAGSSGGATPAPSGDSGGCCSTAGGESSSGSAAVMLLGLAAVVSMTRRRKN